MTGTWSDPKAASEELKRREGRDAAGGAEAMERLAAELGEFRRALEGSAAETGSLGEDIAALGGRIEAALAAREGEFAASGPVGALFAASEGRIAGAVDALAEQLRETRKALADVPQLARTAASAPAALRELEAGVKSLAEAVASLEAAARSEARGRDAALGRMGRRLDESLDGPVASFGERLDRVEGGFEAFLARISRAHGRRRAALWAAVIAICLASGFAGGVWIQRDHGVTALLASEDALFRQFRARFRTQILQCLDAARSAGGGFHCYLAGPPPQPRPSNATAPSR